DSQQGRITFHTRRSHYIQKSNTWLQNLSRQVTANENITIPPRTEIIVPGYIGNDVSFNSGLIGLRKIKSEWIANSSDASGPSRKELSRNVCLQKFELRSIQLARQQLTPDPSRNAELSPRTEKAPQKDRPRI
ncbi:hypothetical protein TNCV_1613111, partial [Trichonephila clavipes]